MKKFNTNFGGTVTHSKEKCETCNQLEKIWPDLKVLVDYSLLDKKDRDFILGMVSYLKNKGEK